MRNMKFTRPPLAAIFFMTNFYRAGGVPWPPLDPLLVIFTKPPDCLPPAGMLFRECYPIHSQWIFFSVLQGTASNHGAGSFVNNTMFPSTCLWYMHWRIQGRAHLGVQILSFSCSFRQKSCKLIG